MYQSESLMYGPIPYSVFNPAPPTAGTITDVPTKSKPETATIIAWMLIGVVFLLLAIPLIRSFANTANETADDAQSESVEHIENRREAIDTVTDNARDSIKAIANGTEEPATVVVSNAQDSIDAISSESISEIQNVADQATTDLRTQQ